MKGSEREMNPFFVLLHLTLTMAPARVHELPVSGAEARQQCRENIWSTPTSGIASGFLQANLIVLPSRYAGDFRILCARNTVPCPLLASSATPGDFESFVSHVPGVRNDSIAAGLDIRKDIPKYNVYINGELSTEGINSVQKFWDNSDHVGFLIGCSYSFENALAAAGLPPAHMLHGRSVPMYRTNIPLCPAGVFKNSTYVVSMRLYRAGDVERVRDITRPYVTTHGEPIAWGWDGMRTIGIEDVNIIQWGEAPVNTDGLGILQIEEEAKIDGLVPVFWGCGVSPQEAVMKAKIPGTVIGHTPGHMLVMDVREDEVLQK